MDDLLGREFEVINVGLGKFAQDLIAAGFPVIDKPWAPPAGGDTVLARQLADLADDTLGLGQNIRSANQQAFQRLIDARPVLVEVTPAREAIPRLTDHTFLHAGPPITWQEMCGAMRGAVIGGLLYEKLARTPLEAKDLAASGAIEFAPCHSYDAVGPMAGILTPHMPVLVVENTTHGTKAFATMNEGWGRTLRFGAFDLDVLERLAWFEEHLGPMIDRAVRSMGGLDIKSLIARALHMGDECHNRDLAATALLFKEIVPALSREVREPDQLDRAVQFLSLHEHFSLNIIMAACKSSLLAAHGIPFSTMVTAIARNGVDLGIQVSGMGSHWFTAPAKVPQGLYFTGYSPEDANPDLGDSAITETAGIGAFAMAGAPAIVRFVGGTPQDAVQFTNEMYEITLGENSNFTLPSIDFRGTPTGIDVRLVVETGIAPVINTGIAHKEPGHGLVGAGVVRAPLEAFVKGLEAMHSTWVQGE